MALTDKTIKRGDTGTFSIAITSDKKPVNLTGWTVWFTVRKTPALLSVKNDINAVISKKITNLDNTGIVVISITSEETEITSGTYLYEIQYTDSLGNTYSTPTYNFIITDDITRDR